MEIIFLSLLFIWQGATFFEPESRDDVLINIPDPLGAPGFAGSQNTKTVGGITSLAALRNKNVVRQRYDYSCGSAALTTFLNNFLGLELDEQRVMNGMLTYGERERIMARRGFSLADMKRFVAALGYKSGGFRGEFSDLEELTQPALLRITYGDFQHFVVLRDIQDQRVFIADPAFGNLSLTQEEFLKLWDGVLFLVYAEQGQRLSKLELTESDLAYMDEERASELLQLSIPNFYQQMDRNADISANHRLYFKP
jgi:hypothetical protein